MLHKNCSKTTPSTFANNAGVNKPFFRHSTHKIYLVFFSCRSLWLKPQATLTSPDLENTDTEEEELTKTRNWWGTLLKLTTEILEMCKQLSLLLLRLTATRIIKSITHHLAFVCRATSVQDSLCPLRGRFNKELKRRVNGTDVHIKAPRGIFVKEKKINIVDSFAPSSAISSSKAELLLIG